MKKLKNVHAGEVLKTDFLDEIGMAPSALTEATGMSPTTISGLINGSSRMSAETAIRLSKFFNVSAEFWLNVQTPFDLVEENEAKS